MEPELWCDGDRSVDRMSEMMEGTLSEIDGGVGSDGADTSEETKVAEVTEAGAAACLEQLKTVRSWGHDPKISADPSFLAEN